MAPLLAGRSNAATVWFRRRDAATICRFITRACGQRAAKVGDLARRNDAPGTNNGVKPGPRIKFALSARVDDADHFVDAGQIVEFVATQVTADIRADHAVPHAGRPGQHDRLPDRTNRRQSSGALGSRQNSTDRIELCLHAIVGAHTISGLSGDFADFLAQRSPCIGDIDLPADPRRHCTEHQRDQHAEHDAPQLAQKLTAALAHIPALGALDLVFHRPPD